MSFVQTITNTRLSGQHTFTFQNTAQAFTEAEVIIDRTVTGGLNSLTPADTLTVTIDYSPDGGTTWLNIAGETYNGGVVTWTKNGNTFTQNTEGFGVSIGQPFPTGTGFRVNTDASTAVRIAGTITYNP